MKRILTFLFLFSSLFASSQTQFLGAPNTTVVVKGNMKVDSILYLPKRSKTPTDTGALRYQISDSSLYVWTGNAWRKAKNDGTVTSVGLTMPSAFSVANSPVTSSGTLAVTATGTVSEYIRGDGTLGTLPSSGGGGGSGVNYYLNGSVSQGTIGGSTYYEMNKTPVIGAGTDFSRASDGLIAQFITDANDPNRLLIPAGAWNFELYFSASSAGGTPSFYIELFEYDGTNFTSIASSVSNPISITNGTAVSLYVASLAVPETILTTTDRLAVRISVNVSGRTITLHTEDNNLAQVITTFSGGLVSLNGLTANDQFFTTGTSGSDFNISSTSATHTFNLPTASSTVRGALSSANWTTFNNKVNISDTAAMLTNYIRHAGNGLTKTGQALSVDTAAIATRARVQKGIDSVASVRVGGTGTINRSAKFTAIGPVGHGSIADSSSSVAMTILSGGNVGINTSAPAQRLHVAGSVLITNTNALGFYNASTVFRPVITYFSDNNVYFDAEDGAQIYRTLGTERARLNATGFGIGTNNPAYKLDISGTLRNTTGAAFATSSGNVLIGKTVDAGVKLDVVGSIANTTGANFATSSGNVGIGTTSPNSKLEIYTATAAQVGLSLFTANETAERTTYSASPALQFSSYQSAAGGPFTKTSDIVANADGTVPSVMRLWTKASGASTPSERMRITADGNVGIGNTSPSEKLHVTGRIRATTIDSTSTAINMLYADATGVIKKAAVPTGGSGTVTSVATGFGLSGGTITTTGTLLVDSASVATRARVQKGIDSVATLANTKVGGTGITGYFPKWTGASTQDTSQLFQLGRNIGIGTATPTYRIHLPDAGNTANQAMIAGSVFGSDGNGQTVAPSSGAMAYYGQGSDGYLYGAQSSGGKWGVNTRSISDAVLSVNGDVKIVTIDSTSTARNMLYQDANGVIKKSAVPSGLTMADDVMTASGSWIATKDAGSGVTINNVAYTTNGTTKMVTIDGSFYIPETSWTDATWITVSTIPSGYRPSKTLNWNSSYIISGAEYERSDNTDFTGACDIAGQMRIRDDGTVQINATMNTNSIAAGGTDYIIVQFTQSYIIK